MPETKAAATAQVSPKLLDSVDDLLLTEVSEGSYTFEYGTEQYQAFYTPDNWKIINSYKIRNKADMGLICKALSDIHPIPTADYQGNRTVDSLVYEWEQHNIAYDILPDTSEWKKNVIDVDLNPADEGKSFIEMARERLR